MTFGWAARLRDAWRNTAHGVVSRMLEAPTRAEWLFVYGPLTLALIAALAVEVATARIPNWLTVPTLAYLLGARLVLGPAAAGWYVLSLVIGAVVVLGYLWRNAHLGGGGAKMAVAASAAFPPLLAALFAGLLILACFTFEWTQRWHGRRQMRGSLLLLVVTLAAFCIPDIVAGVRYVSEKRAAVPPPANNVAPTRTAPASGDHGEDW